MKIAFSRFIIIVVLVLSSISICLSNDNSCEDRAGYTKAESSSHSMPQEQTENHHCLCSLSCNNLFLDFSTMTTKNSPIIISLNSYHYIQTTYPQVLVSLDKPPLV